MSGTDVLGCWYQVLRFRMERRMSVRRRISSRETLRTDLLQVEPAARMSYALSGTEACGAATRTSKGESGERRSRCVSAYAHAMRCPEVRCSGPVEATIFPGESAIGLRARYAIPVLTSRIALPGSWDDLKENVVRSGLDAPPPRLSSYAACGTKLCTARRFVGLTMTLDYSLM
eukprot:622830-Rhodomonas_salina.3